MQNKATSAFVRIPFVLEQPDQVNSLALQLWYNDGIVGYLNGAKIVELNAPSPATWNSKAVAKRDKSAALQPVVIDLGTFRALWQPGTNWLALQGLNASVDDREFLVNARLLAGSTAVPAAAYLERPTPGASNNVQSNLGRVADTKFSRGRGFVSAPFDLVLSTATPGSVIRYTLDGSVPTESTGMSFSGSIRVDRSVVVRAAAFKAGYRPTDVDTHTYIFLSSVVSQPARPSGFPATWSGVAADYAMDPRIAGAAPYASRMAESLQSLPSLAITTPVDNLFGSSAGIYANPERGGVNWERPVSVEWIRADGTSDFQVDCGLRVQGGYFRQRSVTQKHSLRLLFKGEYGSGQLHQDLFGEFGAAQDFDTLVLRAGANDGYAWDAARDTEQFLRDEFGRRCLLAMGQPSPRGRFVHVYLNGLYWGVYNLTERPAEDFSAAYLGGEPEEWDAINSGDVKSGSLDAWNAFLSGVRAAKTQADYQRLKGLNPDGTPNESYPEYLDAPNYIDYMLVNMWGGNWDWPFKNFWFGRHRGVRTGGFKFYLWDFENTMGNNRDRSPLNMVAPRSEIAGSWVGEPHDRLKALGEYQLEFADRVQRHFFNGGTLSPETLVTRYRALADAVEPAIIAETARWGDDNWPIPQDLTDWQRERDWLLNTLLAETDRGSSCPTAERGSIPANRRANDYPGRWFGSAHDADPAHGFRQRNILHDEWAGSAAAGRRRPARGGAIRSGAAGLRSNGRPGLATVAGTILLASPAVIKARARQGTEWSPLNETEFTFDSVAASATDLVISEFCYRPADPATEAERGVTSDRDDFEFLELMNLSDRALDLTGVRFTAGVLFNFPTGFTLPAGGRTVLVRSRAAFVARYGTGAIIAGEYEGNLSNTGEEIAMQDAVGQDIQRFAYLDRAPWPPSANQGGYTVVLQRPVPGADLKDPALWRASVQPGGSPGESDALIWSGSALADANANGQPDLFDYAFGGVLSDPEAGLQVSIEPVALNGQSTPRLVVSFPRNLAADDARVILETADTVRGPWRSEGSDFSLVGEERASGRLGLTRRSFQLNTPLTERAVFVRLSVALGP